MLETQHRGPGLGPALAAAVICAWALAGGVVGALQGSVALTGLALVAPVAALLGLGTTPEGALWRGAGLVVVALLGLVIAGGRGWSALRPLALLPVLAALGLGVVLTARRGALPPEIAPGLVLCLATVWLGQAVSFALRLPRLTRLERALLPLATLWCLGLAAFYAPLPVRLAGVACAGALLAGVWARLEMRAAPPAGVLTSLLTTAALAGLASLPWLEPSGLALAGLALLLLRLARRAGSALARAASHLTALAALLTATLQGTLLEAAPEQGAALRLLAGAALAVLLLLHYRDALRDSGPGRGAGLLAAGSLASGGGALWCTLMIAARLAFPGEGAALLAQTVTLALLAVTALGLGRWRGLREPIWLGLAAVLALAIKVLALDLLRLEGAAVVSSMLCLGLVALAASLALRRRGLPAQR